MIHLKKAYSSIFQLTHWTDLQLQAYLVKLSGVCNILQSIYRKYLLKEVYVTH